VGTPPRHPQRGARRGRLRLPPFEHLFEICGTIGLVAGGMSGGGGWGKRGHGVPLNARVRVGEPDLPEKARDQPVPPCPGRHCWVAEAVDGRGEKRPGLLVEWRLGRNGWEGRVIYPSLLRPAGAHLGNGWVLVEEWLAADQLTPG
jgi:hypothetical protein